MTTQILLNQLEPEDLKQLIQEAIRDEIRDCLQQREQSPYITISDAAELLKVTKPTIYDYQRRGLFKFLKIGSRTLIRRADVINALNTMP